MGTGVLWAKQSTLDAMPAYQLGSNMAHEVDATAAQFEHGALKYQAGTPSVSGAVGLAAALDTLTRFDLTAIVRHDSALVGHFRERAAGVPGLRVLGTLDDLDKRVPVFTFTLAGVPVAAIVKGLDERGIAVRAGDMAALPLLKRLASPKRCAPRATSTRPSTRWIAWSMGSATSAAAAIERRRSPGSLADTCYLNGSSVTLWQVPQAAVYGIGIARPGRTPSTPTLVLSGTSNTWDLSGPCQ